MNLSERWHQLTESIRTRPMPWAIGAGVGLSAVLAGGLAAAAISSGRQATGDARSTSPTVSASASASTSASEQPSPSPIAAATATATASPTASATPAPTPLGTPLATPTATPANGLGGATPPAWDIEGTWTALPPLPDPYWYAISDVLYLEDGSLIVFRSEFRPGAEGASPVRYDEDRRAWVPVAIEETQAGPQSFAMAADGRIYTFDEVVDPSTNPWQVDPFLAHPDEAWAGTGLDAGADGRIYLTTLSLSQVTFEIYDALRDERETSASIHQPIGRCVVQAPGDEVIAMGDDRFAFYDTASDSWSDVTNTPGEQHCHSAGFGPDGRLYMDSMMWPVDIHAYDRQTGTWLSVEPPPTWISTPLPEPDEVIQPRFFTGPDGRLWALSQTESFAFTPDN